MIKKIVFFKRVIYSQGSDSKMNSFVKAIGIWLATVFALSTVHWMCIQFIATYCSPWCFLGPIYNFMNLGSPVCHAVNRFQLEIANHYALTWAMAVPVAIATITKK